MSRALLLAMTLLLLADCGIRRPLIPPSEIPAYEEKQRKKRERLEQEERNATQPPAAPVQQ